jgi:uncharacterized protein YqjF (DUF2071 family)
MARLHITANADLPRVPSIEGDQEPSSTRMEAAHGQEAVRMVCSRMDRLRIQEAAVLLTSLLRASKC